MRASLRGIVSIISLGFCLYTAPSAFGAAAVALGKVNTSLGVVPNTVTNKWKLQADPAIASSNSGPTSRPSPTDPIFVFGSLSVSYDPTILTLATVSNKGKIGCINYLTAVQGMGDYVVTGYDILTNDGGYYQVDLTNCRHPVTLVGNVGGGEAGEVFDIQFQVNKCEVKTVPIDTTDQFFFVVNLSTITGQGTDDPGLASIFANEEEGFPTDSLTIGLRGDPNNPQTQTVVTADDINPFFVGDEEVDSVLSGIGIVAP